jgi:hypothetical protein
MRAAAVALGRGPARLRPILSSRRVEPRRTGEKFIVRPLVSPILEYRLMGRMQVALGCALAAVATAAEGVLTAVVVVLFEAAFFGTVMYLVCYRRFARGVLADPAPAPTEEREPEAATLRRIGSTTGALALSFVVIAALTVPSVVAGVGLGNGAACLQVARLWRRWEDEYGRLLLREPRWRFSRAGRRGWGRGRGMLDPQDFYAAVPRDPPHAPRPAKKRRMWGQRSASAAASARGAPPAPPAEPVAGR